MKPILKTVYRKDQFRGFGKSSNIKHGGGSTNFVAIVSRVGSLKKSGDTWIAQPPGSDPWGSGDFRAAIYPVNIVQGFTLQSKCLENYATANRLKHDGDRPSKSNSHLMFVQLLAKVFVHCDKPFQKKLNLEWLFDFRR